MDAAIEVERLGKRYRIGKPEPYYTLRDTLLQGMTAPWRAWKRLSGGAGAGDGEETFWALREVGFEVPRGQVLGVIGRNGAGKTTLLKVLSRITAPTEGRARVRGRVGSLLEVGTGFHQELTGRENIYLNGALLGMRKEEIRKKFDDIVAFSEVERFLDTPVKRYSSGMYVRLAFAVAAHLEPEVLLVDEVLSVGDAAFQKKSLGKMSRVAQEGRTVLFVSHNMGAVRGWCRKALWLDRGRVVEQGETQAVVQRYLDASVNRAFQYESREYGLTVEGVVLKNGLGEETARFGPADELTVEVRYHARSPLKHPRFFIVIEGINGRCLTASMLLDGKQPSVLAGRGRIGCRFRSLPLLPESYTLQLGIRAGNGKTPILPLQEVASFEVAGDLRERGFESDRLESQLSRSVHVVVPYEWILPDGSRRPVHLNGRPAEA